MNTKTAVQNITKSCCNYYTARKPRAVTSGWIIHIKKEASDQKLRIFHTQSAVT